MKRWLLAVALVLTSQSVSISGEIETQQSTLYPYKSQVVLQEDFISGSLTNGTTGALGWGFTNGSTTILVSETNRPGIVQRSTSAVSGTIATTYLYPGSSSVFDNTSLHDITWIVRTNQTDANTILRVGSADQVFGTSPPSGGVYFEKLGADTNWFCVTRQAATETRTDSTIAVNTSFNIFRYQRLESSVVFSINNTVVCTHTTNLLTTGLSNPFTLIENSAAAAKTLDHDYFQLRLTSLTR